MAGLVCGGLALWWDLHTTLGWRVARFSQGRLAPKLGMHAVLGWHRSSVAASLARRDRVVAADLPVAKGGRRSRLACGEAAAAGTCEA